jgi:hypothetical protein
VEPSTLDSHLVKAVSKLDAAVAFTMSSDIVWSTIEQLVGRNQDKLLLNNSGFFVPVAKSLNDVITSTSSNTKDGVISCVEENFMLIWGENMQTVLSNSAELERILVEHMVGGRATSPPVVRTPRLSRHNVIHPTPEGDLRNISSYTPTDTGMLEKLDAIQVAIDKEEIGSKLYDPENAKPGDFDRPFLLTHAITIGLAIVLVIVVEMACVAKV